MKVPMYLRLLLPLTLAACGYALWDDLASESLPVAGAKPREVHGKTNGVRTVPHSQLPTPVYLDLFPDQGEQAATPPVDVPLITAAPELQKPDPPRAPPMPFRIS